MNHWSKSGSSTLKVIVGLGMGVVIGSGATLAFLGFQPSNTSQQSAANTSRSSSKISEAYCPPVGSIDPAGGHPTQAEYDMCLQYQSSGSNTSNTSPPATNQTAPSGSYSPMPSGGQYQNQYTAPTGNQPVPTSSQQPAINQNNQYQPTGQYPNGQFPVTNGTQQPANGQYPNPNLNQNQQFNGQPGQYQQPYNAATTFNNNQAPQLGFQQPAGLQDPDKCFREKGGEALVSAVHSGKMTPALMSSAASCFMGNFNSGSGTGQGQSGQGGPQGQFGQGGASGQGTQPFGQVSIFSGDFIKTMSSVKPPANDCVAKVAGEAVADKMFTQGVQPDIATRDKIFAAGCFGPPPNAAGGGQPGQPGFTPGHQFAGPPLEVVDCLNKIQGYGDIQSGKQAPSPTEFSAGQACYAKANAMPFFVPPSQVLENSPLALCAKAVIGVTDISAITPNSLTKDQKQRMRQCYAPTGEQALANTQPSLSQEAADCVKKIMGETAFAQVSTGKLEPTAQQRKAVGTTCFPKKVLSGIARLSQHAVPLTQTEALMADIDAKLLPEPAVAPPSQADATKDPDAAQFKLTGAVNVDTETVDVYVNSNATIITTPTKKSADGQNTWTTTMAFSSLSKDEKHTLYTVVTNSDGSTVRSPLVSFAAKAKAASATDTSTTTSSNNSMMTILYGALGVGVLGALTFFIVRRKRATQN